MLIACEHHIQIHSTFLTPENGAENVHLHLLQDIQVAPRAVLIAQVNLNVDKIIQWNKEVLESYHK